MIPSGRSYECETNTKKAVELVESMEIRKKSKKTFVDTWDPCELILLPRFSPDKCNHLQNRDWPRGSKKVSTLPTELVRIFIEYVWAAGVAVVKRAAYSNTQSLNLQG